MRSPNSARLRASGVVGTKERIIWTTFFEDWFPHCRWKKVNLLFKKNRRSRKQIPIGNRPVGQPSDGRNILATQVGGAKVG